MKKSVLFVVSFCMLALPVGAATNFYRASNGNIVVEMTDCTQVNKLMQVANLPDDPPDDPPGSSEELDQNDEQDEEQGAEQEGSTRAGGSRPVMQAPGFQQGTQTLLNALIGGEDVPNTRTSKFLDVDEETKELTTAFDFEERQESFVTYVRDVNWKTGLQITWRDFSFFRRLKMACSGINQLSKPLRFEVEMYAGSLDDTIEKGSQAFVDQLTKAVRERSFSEMAKLSVYGLANAIETRQPFLLLLIDEETYNQLVAIEPKIATLYDDMYTFFKIRAIRMPQDFDENTKALIDVVKIGKGNSFKTWHVMEEFAEKMLELDRQDKLNAKDEREIHIWRLDAMMNYVRESVRVERRAAELAVKDPQNASMVEQINKEPKKKPSLDEKARELLQKSTQAEIKALLRKYYSK